MILRDYQEAAVDELGKHDKVVLYSPTGSGKTEIAIEFIRRNPGKSIWFLCHRIGLVSQASRRFYAAGIPHGIVQGNNTVRTYERVLVGTIQTVVNRIVNPPDIIIVDEAHNAPGSVEYRKLLNLHSKAKLIGLTATPFPAGMGQMFGHLSIAATIPGLIMLGYLVDVDIYAPAKYQPDLSGVSVVAGDWQRGEVEDRITRSEILGGIVEHWERLAKGKPTIVFAHSLKHSQALVGAFQDHGYRAAHIDCYTEDDDRERVNQRFASGDLDIISNVSVYSEGWDAPRCEVMILARPTRSMTRYIQMSGRILRPYPGKRRAMILDHSDTCTRLGYPTEDLPLSLSYRQPVKRWELDAAEKRLPICPGCNAVRRPKETVCRKCGYMAMPKSTISTFSGDLLRLSKHNAGNIPAARIVRPRLDSVRELGPQAVFSQLLWIAHEREYKDGWAAHKYKEIWGTWPRDLVSVAENAHSAVRAYVRHLDIKHAKNPKRRLALVPRPRSSETLDTAPPWR